LLAHGVAASFHGDVRFVVENYGDSALAKKFGVTHYPAIFVDDILVATPNDFGFYGKGEAETGGRYAPLQSAAAHERFRTDLARMIRLVLDGRSDDARAQAAPAPDRAVAAFPTIDLDDLDGAPVTAADREGRVVLVDFWATWCPPCRATLPWLKELYRKFGERLVILAVAVESPEPGVRKLASDLDLPVTWILGTPEIVRAFGDVSAVPTLLLFDREGRSSATFFGAPPTLHAEVEARIERLAK
jgi:thiol-disulfide isomerase/thioredoxin